MTIFRKILQKSVFVAALAVPLLLSSCSDLADTNEKSHDGMAYIRVGVGEVARDALPDFEVDGFTEYKLSMTSGSKTTTKQWIPNADLGKTAYQMMNNEVFSIPLGTYTFTLTANDDAGAIYKGTIKDKEIEADTSLSFVLEYSRSASSGNGSLKLDVTYPTDGVKKIVVNRYSSTDTDTYSSATPTNLVEITALSEIGSGKIARSFSTPSGAYIIEFLFYGGENKDILIGKWLRYAYITSDKTSTDTFEIESFDDVYTVTYENMTEATFTVTTPVSFTPRMDITLPALDAVKRTGYTFAGWYASADEDGNPTGNPITGWKKGTKTANVTVYAKWTADTYTVSFYTNLPADGALSETPFATQTAYYDSTTTAPATNPERTGYRFAHWTNSADGAAFDFENTTITGDLSLYAVWSYDVTFKANSDSATGDTMAAQTFLASWQYTQSAALTANTYALAGHSFLGWATAADATEAAFADGETVSFGAPTTLYAVWHDDSKGYAVSFDANGGTAVTTQIVTGDGTVTEPTNCTREDYVLVGWYTDAALETAYDFATPVTANLRLYAKWVQTSYYVSATGSNTAGDGTKTAPYKTMAKAVSQINTVGSSAYDYAVVVSGTITERISISSSELSTSRAKTLTIRGASGSDTDKINGTASNKGTAVLEVRTVVPVAMADITIYGGKNNHTEITYLGNSILFENYGGGVYIASGSTFTMKSGVISDNQAYCKSTSSTSGTYRSGYVYGYCYGGGVANYGSFIMEGGTITGNTAYSYVQNYTSSGYSSKAEAKGGGVYNSGTFTMKGGVITGNTAEGYSKAYSKYIDTYGGGVYNTGTFTMTGGTISGNTVKHIDPSINTGTPCGSGVYSGTNYFSIGGEASVTGGDIIYLTSQKYITIVETLTAATPVATVQPYSSTVGNQVLTAADGINIATEAPKFALTVTNRTIDSEGKLALRTAYTITYKDKGNTTFSGDSTGFPTSHGAGETTVLPVPKKKEYTFGGWYLTSACDGTAVTELNDENCTGNITLYALWTARTDYRTITYKDEGGGTYPSYTGGLVTKHYPGEKETLVDGTKTNYSFEGWYTSDDGGVTLSGEKVTELTDDNCTVNLTLYAKWKPHYTITYIDSVSGEAYSSAFSSSAYYFNEGESKTLPAATKTEFVFDGWYLSNDYGTTLIGEKVTKLTDENCKGNLTLYAKWKPHYTITYIDSVSGEAYAGLIPSYFNEGETKPLPPLTKDDNVFEGWYTSDDGGVTLSGEKVTKLTDENCKENLTLYAKWLPYYTVTYKDKGGAAFSGTFTDGTPRSTYYAGDSATTTLPRVTKDGSQFLGWYIDESCTGAPLADLAGQSGNITLYAWWSEPPVDIQIEDGDISITKAENEGVVTLTASDGFSGYRWQIQGEDAVDVIEGSSVSADGKVFTFNTETLLAEHVYVVRVIAQNKYGYAYSTNITITK